MIHIIQYFYSTYRLVSAFGGKSDTKLRVCCIAGGQTGGAAAAVDHLFVSAHEDGGYATWKVRTNVLHAAIAAADEPLSLGKPVEAAKVPYGMCIRFAHSYSVRYGTYSLVLILFYSPRSRFLATVHCSV